MADLGELLRTALALDVPDREDEASLLEAIAEADRGELVDAQDGLNQLP